MIHPAQLIEEETLPDYNPEEFYPVHIGDILHEKYQVLGKLGYGANSTVWLCRDIQYEFIVPMALRPMVSSDLFAQRKKIRDPQIIHQDPYGNDESRASGV